MKKRPYKTKSQSSGYLRLRELRNEKGMTQTELGELLGVEPNTISRWESGQRDPPLEILHQISKIYGIQLSELFYEGLHLSEREKDLIAYYREYPEDMDKAMAFLRSLNSDTQN